MAGPDPAGPEQSTNLRCYSVQVRDVSWLVQAVAGKLMDLADEENWYGDDPDAIDRARDYGAEVAYSFAECSPATEVVKAQNMILPFAAFREGSGTLIRTANSAFPGLGVAYFSAPTTGLWADAPCVLPAGDWTIHLIGQVGPSYGQHFAYLIPDGGGAQQGISAKLWTAGALASNVLKSENFTLAADFAGRLKITQDSGYIVLQSIIFQER